MQIKVAKQQAWQQAYSELAADLQVGKKDEKGRDEEDFGKEEASGRGVLLGALLLAAATLPPAGAIGWGRRR